MVLPTKKSDRKEDKKEEGLGIYYFPPEAQRYEQEFSIRSKSD
jgi:hypothetical protein